MVTTGRTTKLDSVLNGIAVTAGFVMMMALTVVMFKAIEPVLTPAFESFNRFNHSVWGLVGVTPTKDPDTNGFYDRITIGQAALLAGASFAVAVACVVTGILAEKYQAMKSNGMHPILSRVLVALGVCWRLAVCLLEAFVVGAMADARPPLTVAGLGAIVWCLAWRGYLPRRAP